MENLDEKFIREAIRLAMEGMNSNAGGPFGCVIVKDGEIISTGYNCVTSTNDPTAHAEVNAIREACKKLNSFQLNGCTLYTSCEPCPMCLGAIYWARPDRVVYAASRKDAAYAGFDDDFIYHEFRLHPSERKFKLYQHGADEAAKLFDVWNKKSDKMRY
ncbi:MAG: nucleoside deaminase [Bacteroidia bacterium]|nr:nucleoside deaminase [Bacteroidia bacterium]